MMDFDWKAYALALEQRLAESKQDAQWSRGALRGVVEALLGWDEWSLDDVHMAIRGIKDDLEEARGKTSEERGEGWPDAIGVYWAHWTKLSDKDSTRGWGLLRVSTTTEHGGVLYDGKSYEIGMEPECAMFHRGPNLRAPAEWIRIREAEGK